MCRQGFERYGMSLCASEWQTLAISIDRLHQRWSKPDDIALWKFAVANIITYLKSYELNMELVQAQEDYFLLLITDPNETRVRQFAERLVQETSRYLKLTVSVGVGSTVRVSSQIGRSWREAVQSLQHRVTSGEGRVLYYDELKKSSDPDVFYSVDLHERLLLHYERVMKRQRKVN